MNRIPINNILSINGNYYLLTLNSDMALSVTKFPKHASPFTYHKSLYKVAYSPRDNCVCKSSFLSKTTMSPDAVVEILGTPIDAIESLLIFRRTHELPRSPHHATRH